MYPKLLQEVSENNWAIMPDSFQGILKGIDGSLSLSDYELFHKLEEETKAATLSFLGERDSESRYTRIKGTTGSLFIDGPVVPRSSGISRISGLTGIYGLTEEFLVLEANEQIEKILLVIDSPGGSVKGVSELVKIIAESEKPVEAINLGLMASAAYWIASAADKIYSTDTGLIGSIGTVLTMPNPNEKQTVIVSEQTPNKRLDITSREGKAEVQRIVNDLASIFIKSVAQNRGVKEKVVLKEYGKGSVFVAKDALIRGMIDEVVALKDHMEALSLSEDGDSDITAEMDIEAATPGFKNFPIVDRPWDATAAKKRVRSFTGSTKKPSASYRNAFFWYDAAQTENFGAYKLPFTDIVNGRQSAIRRGVFAAKAAMAGARGGVQIPAKDRSAVLAHINRYVAKIEKEDAKKKPKTEVKQMETLKEVRSEFPAIDQEVKELEAKAKQDGVGSVYQINKRLAAYIESDDYSVAVKKLACKVLKGESDINALESAITVLDAQKESQAVAAAQAETEDLGESAASPQVETDEAEFEASVAAQRAAL